MTTATELFPLPPRRRPPTGPPPRLVEALLLAALRRPAAERSSFLGDACDGDGALQREVEKLLAVESDHLALLDRPAFRLLSDSEAVPAPLAPQPASAPCPTAPAPGDSIGGFRVLEELGRGGIGVVLRAVAPDGEQVALKLLRPELVAALGHPELGHAEPGRAELDRSSVPADGERRRGGLGELLARRFERERQILAKLAHPHIARLKEYPLPAEAAPGEPPFLVMEYVDGEAIDRHCSDQGLTLSRRLALFVKVCSAVDHAHRQGVIHRDLKPGNILVDRQGEPRLLDFGIARLLEPDGEQTPLTVAGAVPMTPAFASPEQRRGDEVTVASDIYSLGVILRLLVGGQRPRGAASAADTDPRRRAAPWLPPPLQAILGRAMADEPAHRYASAADLAADLERHLAGRPVLARRARGQLGDLLRRRALEAAALLLCLLLGALLVDRPWQDRPAVERQADTMAAFLDRLLDPQRDGGPPPRELLDRGAAALPALADHPRLRSQLLRNLGRGYSELALYEQASSFLNGALTLDRGLYGPGHPSVAASLEEVAALEATRGRFQAAESHLLEAIAIRRRLLPPDDPQIYSSLNALAAVRMDQGDYASARPLFQQVLTARRAAAGTTAVATAATPPVTAAERQLAVARLNTGVLRYYTGDYRGAAELFQQNVSFTRRLPVCDGLCTASTVSLAAALRELGDLDRAEALVRQTLAIYQQRLGGEHPAVANALANLADTRLARGDTEDALRLIRHSIELRRRFLGGSHPHMGSSLVAMGEILERQGEPRRAAALAREALAIYRDTLPADHPRVAEARRLLLAAGGEQRGDG